MTYYLGNIGICFTFILSKYSSKYLFVGYICGNSNVILSYISSGPECYIYTSVIINYVYNSYNNIGFNLELYISLL